MHFWRKISLILLLLSVALAVGCIKTEPVIVIQTRVTTPTQMLSPLPTATRWVVTATPVATLAADDVAATPMPVVRWGFPADSEENANTEAVRWLLADALGKASSTSVQPIPVFSDIELVDALCSGDLDLAWLATPAYLTAYERCSTEVLFRGIRNGTSWHRGQILVQSPLVRQQAGLAPIVSLADLEGLAIAYTQQESTSGHYLPRHMLHQANVALANALYTGGDRQAVLALYRGEVDVAATYWLPIREDGSAGDARALLIDTMPDIGQRLQILALTQAIPNDPLVCRADLLPSLRLDLEAGLAQLARSAEGRDMLMTLYGLEGLEPAADGDYDRVRELGATLEIDWLSLVH